jgi:hypothetical protein
MMEYDIGQLRTTDHCNSTHRSASKVFGGQKVILAIRFYSLACDLHC